MQHANGDAAGSAAACAVSAAGQAAAERARRRRAQAGARPEDLRAACEDDDGYDPYSDYMDRLAREGGDEPCADPWR